MLNKETVAIYCKNNMEYIHTLCGGKNAELLVFNLAVRTVTTRLERYKGFYRCGRSLLQSAKAALD
jgi:hypothetical protein